MGQINKIAFIFIISLVLIACTGCAEQILGNSVDVGFRNGSHEQYDFVRDWEYVHKGIISDTVDLHFAYGTTKRLHYVTSIEIID